MSKYESFFVSSEVHERKITLGDGSEHVLHFRELPAADFRRYAIAQRSDDEAARVDAMDRLVAACLCEVDGSPAMSLEEARRLKPHVSAALFEAVLDVNRVIPAEDAGNA